MNYDREALKQQLEELAGKKTLIREYLKYSPDRDIDDLVNKSIAVEKQGNIIERELAELDALEAWHRKMHDLEWAKALPVKGEAEP